MAEKGLFKVAVYVSEADLNDVELKKIVDKLGLDVVLCEIFGFDRNEVVCDVEPFYYEATKCEHRQRMYPHAITKGIRYSGIERLDKKWIEGGMVSAEAKLSARNDKDYLVELKKLGG